VTILVAVVERQGANDRGNILPLPTKNTDCLENLMLSYPSHNPLGVATPKGFELPDDLPYFNHYFYKQF
jgi:hypothetical protein